MEQIRRTHLTDDCLAAVATMRMKYADLMALKGDDFTKVYYKALLSFVNKNNPIVLRYGFNDPTTGRQIIAFDQPIRFVNVPRI